MKHFVYALVAFILLASPLMARRSAPILQITNEQAGVSANPRDVYQTTLHSLGYVADGKSHTLRGVASWNGRSSLGWTLAQWQAVLPAAASLDDEIDGAVVNSLIKTSDGPIKFHFGPGNALFSQPITSCTQSVALEGAGTEHTTLTFIHSNGWNHCLKASPSANKVEARNLTFQSLTTGGTLYGINATFIPYFNVTLDDVKLLGFSSCLLLQNAAGSVLNKVVCESKLAPGSAAAGIGIEFQGRYSFVNHITNSLVQHYAIGYNFKSTGNAANIIGEEDQALTNSAAGEVKQCIRIEADYPGYSPLLYSISNFSCNAYSGFVDARAAAQLDIQGGDWLVEPDVGNWTGAGQDFFRLCRVATGRIQNAYISNNARTKTIGSYIHLISSGATCGMPEGVGASDFKVTDNKFEYFGLTTSAAMIVKDAGTTGIVASGNVFTRGFVVQPTPPPNAFSWKSSDSASAQFLGIVGETLQTNVDAIGVSNLTTANAGQLSVPPGRWNCHAQLMFMPAGGATVTEFRGAFNTMPATLPPAPGNGMFEVRGNWTGSVIQGVGPYIFDFSAAPANTNVYLVGSAAFGGGTLRMSSVVQCARLR